MIVDVVAVNVSTDDERMIALGESAGQFTAQAVGFLRRDLTGNKRLADGIGDYIIRPAPSASLRYVLPLGK